MSIGEPLMAIGRSRYLYDTVKHLCEKGYPVKLIITDEAYEEYDIKADDFKRLAQNVNADFFQTRSLNSPEIISCIEKYQIRVGISANWKYTIPGSFLNLFEYGLLNFHLGNLPDYKGNATVNWSIINGEQVIYANIHQMAVKLDAGDIICRKPIPITPDTYVADILSQAEEIVPVLYEEAIRKITLTPGCYELKGEEKGLRCYPRLPEDGQIDWNRTATEVYRLIRASSYPYSGAFSFLNGNKITIWKAVIHEPDDQILAMPGHVIGIDKRKQTILVACHEGVIEIIESTINGQKVQPSELVKGIRERFRFNHCIY